MSTSPPFRPGQILWAPLIDPQGHGPEDRPCVALACDEKIVAVVAITSTLAEIDPADRVDLPHSPNPAAPCYTGLKRHSAAHCGWQTVAEVGEVIRVMGYASREHLTRIMARVIQIQAQKASETQTGPEPPA
ncbi:MAG: hypothetical protein ACRC33_14630 [Gemmataceae bacterium]